MRIALATWEELPNLSEDDRGLALELEASGVSVVPAVWNDPTMDWAQFDAIVVRSTWRYYLCIDDFLAWVDRAHSESQLWNSRGVIHWNSHKSYLLDLERRGVPVVPTRLCRTPSEVSTALREEGWERAVVKPAVSAGGFQTFLADRESLGVGRAPWDDLAWGSGILVQPYQDEVERSGERSLVFFRGTYSHAFLRAPHLVPSTRLTEGSAVVPTIEEIRVAQKAMDCSPEETLYGRADLVRGDDGRPMLMELELIEPALGLASAEGAPRRFADAVLSAVQGLTSRKAGG